MGNEDFQEVLEDVIGEYQSLHLHEDQEAVALRKVSVFLSYRKKLTISSGANYELVGVSHILL